MSISWLRPRGSYRKAQALLFALAFCFAEAFAPALALALAACARALVRRGFDLGTPPFGRIGLANGRRMKLDSQSLAGKKYPGLMRLSMPIATTALGKLPKMLVQEFFGSYPPLSRVDVLMQESCGSQSM